jgi:ribosomal protein L12E/L44/L45/RPP1/RPP2
MRKLILISAFVLASASAQASDIGSLIPAANDTPAEATPTPADAARPAASRKQASSRSNKTQAQPRETPEQKARQIAAQFGVSW